MDVLYGVVILILKFVVFVCLLIEAACVDVVLTIDRCDHWRFIVRACCGCPKYIYCKKINNTKVKSIST